MLNTINDSLITIPILIKKKRIGWFKSLELNISKVAIVGATLPVYINVDDYHIVCKFHQNIKDKKYT